MNITNVNPIGSAIVEFNALKVGFQAFGNEPLDIKLNKKKLPRPIKNRDFSEDLKRIGLTAI
ncbi:hypothetical protein [Cytobacillus sp. IB215316]|uniref:hypothetical protein n=1 Tax=Cytobacillus sp. IB215316 TaxID=3097354 RepID=UPI002A141D17|nr:hypothetical protein [Cytobacillus sp. IB215316]MDX8360451.1 hypothetical protein [Cytobacillus sp. IB215316]